MSSQVYTLAQPGSFSLETKKSRFLAHAATADSAEAALSFIKEISDPLATHNCWAYRLRQDYRFNDDGEPSGSAGKPILAAIDGQDLINTVVVVTRWFGGTKLGVGGLIRAYGGCAADCLRQQGRQLFIPTTTVLLECDYSSSALLTAKFKHFNTTVKAEKFGAQGVAMTLLVPDHYLAELSQLVADTTRGQGVIKKL